MPEEMICEVGEMLPEEMAPIEENSGETVTDAPLTDPLDVLGAPTEEVALQETKDTTADELLNLRGEVERLRGEAERIADGYAELIELFPSAELRSMPDSFKEAVKRGVPPAAAYALEMRRREVNAKRAAEARKNALATSFGKVDSASDTLYTPDEVRAMSREEVRENYGRIMESMRRWK